MTGFPYTSRSKRCRTAVLPEGSTGETGWPSGQRVVFFRKTSPTFRRAIWDAGFDGCTMSL